MYNINYMNINIYTCKYFQNIYCMCVHLYIHNKYTQYTHTYYVNKNLFWMRLITINNLTALIVHYSMFHEVFFFFAIFVIFVYNNILLLLI